MKTVELQIKQMLEYDMPYYPNPNLIYETRTDINVWPYNRQFRGQPSSDTPIVWEREAGYREIQNPPGVASIVGFENDVKPHGCFQIPCSTTLPCHSRTRIFAPNVDNCVYFSP